MPPRKLRTALTLSAVCLFGLFLLHRSTTISIDFVCPRSPLSNDVLLVLRTGATEALEKLPIHFNTTLTCVPNYVIYSDLEEDIQGHHIQDAAATTGRAGLAYETLYGSGPGGSLDNPGWKLDKWKFLPMIDQALHYKPDARWFVFMEPDTYLSWTNTIHYLSRFNSTQPHYLGKHMFASNVLFGHGGSGFALSKPAMEMVVKRWHENRAAYDKFTREEWAGDLILGKTLKDAGVEMFLSFPHLQGDSLTTIDWNVSKLGREPWCYQPVTWHHMSPAEITTMWRFEQDWAYKLRHQPNAVPQFRDVFKSIIRPRLQPELEAWDNLASGLEFSGEALAKLSRDERNRLSATERNAARSFGACKAACESKPKCLQFSYIPGRCSISEEMKLGHPADPACLEYSNAAGRCIKNKSEALVASHADVIRSGWLMDRVNQYVHELDLSCDTPEGNDWVT